MRARASRRSSSGAVPPCGSEYVTRARKRGPTRIQRIGSELLLDAQQLVVFRDAIRARRRTRLDLPGPERDGEVRDRRVLGLAGAMGDHRAVTVLLREVHRVDRLGERADLVHLHEDGVGDAALDTELQPLGVRYEDVVTDELDPIAELLGRRDPAVRVVLGVAVFDGHDGEAVDETGEEVG